MCECGVIINVYGLNSMYNSQVLTFQMAAANTFQPVNSLTIIVPTGLVNKRDDPLRTGLMSYLYVNYYHRISCNFSSKMMGVYIKNNPKSGS